MAEPGDNRSQTVEPFIDVSLRAIALEHAVTVTPANYSAEYTLQVARKFEAYLIGYEPKDLVTQIFQGLADD